MSANPRPLSSLPKTGRRTSIWLASLWSGAAIMAFELVGARLLMPVFGMGIEVWTAVIAASLGFLALGCWIGGLVADRRPTVLTLAVVLLLAGGSLLAVQAVGRSVPGWFIDLSFAAGACCSATCILAPPLFLLGMVQPVLAGLLLRSTSAVSCSSGKVPGLSDGPAVWLGRPAALRETARTGSVVGRLLAAGTIGGVLGTALTGLLLIPRVGAGGTLLILGGGSVAMALVVLLDARRRGTCVRAIVLAGAAAAAAWQGQIEAKTAGPVQVLERVDGLYGLVEVLEHEGSRALACNGIFQTALPRSYQAIEPGLLIRGRDYIELLPYFRPRTRGALLIGLGGGLHAQSLALYGIDVHAVEIEPAIVRLAARYFGLTADVTVMDGRAFLAREHRVFDAVILDAFIGDSPPDHLFTKEAFASAANHLTADGVLAIHLIGYPGHPATCAVTATLRAVFSDVVCVRSGMADELQHVYLFASRSPLELHPDELRQLSLFGFTGQQFYWIDTAASPVLTDDRTNLNLLSRDIAAEHRRHCLQQRRKPSW